MLDGTQNSRNPANSDSLAGVLSEVMGKFLAGTDDMLPAVVIEYDRPSNRATVRPLIQLLKTDGTRVDRAEIASVPVLNVGGGNAVLSFCLQPGDLGWIKASDRDISLFLQTETGVDVGPGTLRKHDFADSLFIPDQFKKFTIQSGDEESVVLQTLDGLDRIAIKSGEIRITSSDFILLSANTVAINGDIFHLGNNLTIGNLTAGAITGASVETTGGTDLDTHEHEGSPTAPTGAVSDTGPPT